MSERIAISTASRSKWPVLRRPAKMTRNKWSTSRVISRWIASAVFFLGRERLGGILLLRPQAADLFAELHKGMAQFLKLAKLLDFSFGFAHRARCGQRLGYGLALGLKGEPQIRSVPGVTGTSTMTTGLATTPNDTL